MRGALSLLKPSHPAPGGEYEVGCIRGRLAPADDGTPGLFAQVHYPADTSAAQLDIPRFPWFRREVIQEIAQGYGVPHFALRSLLEGHCQLDPAYAPKQAPGTGWPTVVFSSGIWGCCEMYTQFCRELASTGLIVIAVEHEDGSGVFAINGKTGDPIPYDKPPKDVDTAVFRHPYLEKRANELTATATAIMRRDSVGTTGCKEDAALVSILRWADVNRLLLVGHSFGSSGAFRYLRRLADQGQSCPFRGVLLLDLWTASLSKTEVEMGLQIPCALLLSGHWGTDGSCKVARASGPRCLAIVSYADTFHQWISESHLFAPHWLLRKIGIMGPADYQRAHAATVKGAELALKAFLCQEDACTLAEAIRAVDKELVSKL